MTIEFFEGPAGSGKTHNLIERARELVANPTLLDAHQRILALTFMNGARRRLEANLEKHLEIRRRFECKTVDVFAQMIVSRRRSQLAQMQPDLQAAAELSNQFHAQCYLAGRLLESDSVANWVKASFPLVLIDEAQDLDKYRLPLLQRLAARCSVLAAADAFQCLNEDVDTRPLMSWIASHPTPVRLTGSQRTARTGILQVAQAVRNGEDVRPLLQRTAKGTIWRAQGFKLIETPAQRQLLAWTISNELNAWSGKGNVAILTPDKKSKVVRDALLEVQARTWTYKRSGSNFGPFGVEWERDDKELAQDVWVYLELPEQCVAQDIASEGCSSHNKAALERVRRRMDRMARLTGERTFSRAKVIELIEGAVRDLDRFGARRTASRSAMSIHRAKNREFKNVLVLWPYSASGSDDHLRRLIYNAITRAEENCTVIVLGKSRLSSPPFSPRSASTATPRTARKMRKNRKPATRA